MNPIFNIVNTENGDNFYFYFETLPFFFFNVQDYDSLCSSWAATKAWTKKRWIDRGKDFSEFHLCGFS